MPPSTQKQTEALAQTPNNLVNNFAEVVDLFKSKGELMIYSFLKNNARLVAFSLQDNIGNIKINLDETVPANTLPNALRLLKEWTGQDWNINRSSERGEKSLDEQKEDAKKQEIAAIENGEFAQSLKAAFPNAKLLNTE